MVLGIFGVVGCAALMVWGALSLPNYDWEQWRSDGKAIGLVAVWFVGFVLAGSLLRSP
jgi:hypothetical protein